MSSFASKRNGQLRMGHPTRDATLAATQNTRFEKNALEFATIFEFSHIFCCKKTQARFNFFADKFFVLFFTL